MSGPKEVGQHLKTLPNPEQSGTLVKIRVHGGETALITNKSEPVIRIRDIGQYLICRSYERQIVDWSRTMDVGFIDI